MLYASTHRLFLGGKKKTIETEIDSLLPETGEARTEVDFKGL